MTEAELEYFTRRMQQEREAAMRASCAAAASHAELASRYEAVVSAYRSLARAA